LEFKLKNQKTKNTQKRIINHESHTFRHSRSVFHRLFGFRRFGFGSVNPGISRDHQVDQSIKLKNKKSLIQMKLDFFCLIF
jgi:hypothetical protein